MPLSEKQKSEYRHSAESGIAFQWRDLRKRGGADTRIARPKLFFPIFANPETGDVSLDQKGAFSVEVFPKKSDGTDGCWRWGQQKVKTNLAELKATKVENKDRWNVSYRVYLERDGEERTSKPKSVWMGAEFSTDSATKTFGSLVPEVSGVTPKPVELIKQIARLAMDEEDTKNMNAAILSSLRMSIANFPVMLSPANVLLTRTTESSRFFQGNLGIDLLQQAQKTTFDFKAMMLTLQ